MSNFEEELTALVNEWLKRGEDRADMYNALRDEMKRVAARIAVEQGASSAK